MAEKKAVDCGCELDQVRLNMPAEIEISKLADFFFVLGDSTRVKLVSALRINELCVGDLARILNMSDSAISHQLRLLRQSNLVKSRRAGKFIYYSLSDDHVMDIYDIGKIHIKERN